MGDGSEVFEKFHGGVAQARPEGKVRDKMNTDHLPMPFSSTSRTCKRLKGNKSNQIWALALAVR